MKCNIFTVLVGSLLATWFLATRYIFDMLNPNSIEISLLREKIRGNRYERKINVASMPLESIVLATSAPSHDTIMPSATVTPIDCNCSYDVHIFYYGWYGSPKYDKKWLHWNHVRLPHWNKETAKRYSQRRHIPENNDIGSIYYPSLGMYSSHDPAVVKDHMKQIRRAGAGVLVVSWYPPNQHDNEGRASDGLIPLLLDKAAGFGLRITFHIEPYQKRSAESVKDDLKYIIDTYGRHEAFYRDVESKLPVIYVYDSYLIPPESWSAILKQEGKNSIRKTKYDSIMIGLLVDAKHKEQIKNGGWDGFYTYFAVDGMTYGSSFQNFHLLRAYADENNLLFIPSVGPGYDDSPVRPWNTQNTRDRHDGKYYVNALGFAKRNAKKYISITSFNEWHEGTNIERATAGQTRHDSFGKAYQDYGSHGEYYYLDLTRLMLINVH